MLTVDEQIQLAEKIAGALPEVTRNEWQRWTQLAQRYGLERAIRWAERLSKDVTLRPGIKRSNQLIATAMRTQLKSLKGLKPEEQQGVFGNVSWILAIQTLRGSMQNENKC